MWPALIGMMLVFPGKAMVQKIEALNYKSDVVELERYEQKLAKEYESQEIKRLKLSDVVSFPGYAKPSKSGLRK